MGAPRCAGALIAAHRPAGAGPTPTPPGVAFSTPAHPERDGWSDTLRMEHPHPQERKPDDGGQKVADQHSDYLREHPRAPPGRCRMASAALEMIRAAPNTIADSAHRDAQGRQIGVECRHHPPEQGIKDDVRQRGDGFEHRERAELGLTPAGSRAAASSASSSARPRPARMRSPTRHIPRRSASAVTTTSTRESGSSTQSTGTSWIRNRLRSAGDRSSVSKNCRRTLAAGCCSSGR